MLVEFREIHEFTMSATATAMQPGQIGKNHSAIAGIVERREHGLLILALEGGKSFRRILYVNNYGGAMLWEKIKQGLVGAHHLWGCTNLVRQGYEVALAEPMADFTPRRPFPHDLTLLKVARSWLRRDDIIYCGHNVLYWLPFLRSLGVLRRPTVSVLFGLEPLDFSGAHAAVIALTPVAEKQAATLAPKAKIAHLGWGADLAVHPTLPYHPKWLLHCGISGRDFATLSAASFQTSQPIRLVSAGELGNLPWGPSVEIIDGGRGHLHLDKKVKLQELLHMHYGPSAACLLVTMPNPRKDHAFGFTNMIEAMAMGRPMIQTRTGALIDEIDVEKAGCGITVPPADPAALARAMDEIMRDPARGEAMGKAARRLSENHYNIDRYSAQLHELFQSL